MKSNIMEPNEEQGIRYFSGQSELDLCPKDKAYLIDSIQKTTGRKIK